MAGRAAEADAHTYAYGLDMAECPVCRMNVDPAESKWTTVRRGRTVHFCNRACKDAFGRDPGRYGGADLAFEATAEDGID